MFNCKKLFLGILIIMSMCCIAAGTGEAKEYAFFANSYEEAVEIANGQGGELVSFSQGIGVLRKLDYPKSSIAEDGKNVKLYLDEMFTVDIIEEVKAESEQWHLKVLEVEEAWKTSTGVGITVAVIDSGVDSSHEDLQDSIVYTASIIPDNEYGVGQRFDGAYKGPEDYFGHGTHVVGIIGARKNGIGCTGIAPDCKIISIKALEKQGSTGKGKTSWVASAVRLAVEQGADIINLSLGGSSVKSELLYTVIKEAVDKDIPVVCAAGNITGTPMIFYPGAYEETIAVSALKASGDSVTFATQYSNYGEWVDISAPGSSVVSTIPGGYGTKSGTSMACPMVAGGIALLLGEDSSLTIEEVCNLLYSSVMDLGDAGRDIRYGYGALNLKQLLEKYKENYSSVAPVPVFENLSKIQKGTTILMEVPDTAERIVYTTDGTVPSLDSSEFPSEGIVMPPEVETVTINARCIMGDGGLGKTIAITYFFVNGETSLGKRGNRTESFADYGNDRDEVTGNFYKSYRLKVEKEEELKLVFKELNFTGEVYLYDSDKKEKLLAKGKEQENGTIALEWKNPREKTKEVYLMVLVKDEASKPGELSYKIQWECKEEVIKNEEVRKEETKQDTTESTDNSLEAEKPVEIAENVKDKNAEKELQEEEYPAPVISEYEDDWLYAMDTKDNLAKDESGQEESENDVIIIEKEEQGVTDKDTSKEENSGEESWAATKKCILFIVCLGVFVEIIVILWFFFKKKKDNRNKSKE